MYIYSDNLAGPAYDVQLLARMMAVNDVPQRLQFLCLSAQEVSDGEFNFWLDLKNLKQR